jgi:hypothetical protein
MKDSHDEDDKNENEDKIEVVVDSTIKMYNRTGNFWHLGYEPADISFSDNARPDQNTIVDSIKNF